jgi:hypothetical protein
MHQTRKLLSGMEPFFLNFCPLEEDILTSLEGLPCGTTGGAGGTTSNRTGRLGHDVEPSVGVSYRRGATGRPGWGRLGEGGSWQPS